MNTPRVLSIRQPYASAICAGVKPVENRSWSTHYRGPLLIHAGLKAQYSAEVVEYCRARGFEVRPGVLSLGGIIGRANLIDVVTRSSSPWFEGEFGWVLEDAKELPFIPSKGQLGIYYPDQLLLAELRKKGILK